MRVYLVRGWVVMVVLYAVDGVVSHNGLLCYMLCLYLCRCCCFCRRGDGWSESNGVCQTLAGENVWYKNTNRLEGASMNITIVRSDDRMRRYTHIILPERQLIAHKINAEQCANTTQRMDGLPSEKCDCDAFRVRLCVWFCVCVSASVCMWIWITTHRRRHICVFVSLVSEEDGQSADV